MILNIKKICKGIVVTSILAINANATCITEKYCANAYFGVGGFYENINGNSANVKNTGGFLAIGANDVFFNSFHYGADFKIGYGSNKLSGQNLSTLSQNNAIGWLDVLTKFGFNISTSNSPLFVNFLFGGDYMFSNNGVGRMISYVGAGIEGVLAMSSSFRMTYSAGYGYGIGDAYLFGKQSIKSILNGSNQLFMASLGTQTKISENTSFYSKGFVKYLKSNTIRN